MKSFLHSFVAIFVLAIVTSIATPYANAVTNITISSGSIATAVNGGAIGTSGNCVAVSGYLTVPNAGLCVHLTNGGSFSGGTITKSGGTSTRVVIISDTKQGATLNGSSLTVNASNVMIEGLNMTGPNIGNMVTFQTGSNWWVEYNYIHDVGTSISCHGFLFGVIHSTGPPPSANLTINGNVFHHWGNSSCFGEAGYHGIYADSSGTRITNNIMSGGTGGWAIQKQYAGITDCTPGVISGNTIFNNQGGIVFNDEGNACGIKNYTITNNIIVNNGIAGTGGGGSAYGIDGFHWLNASGTLLSNNMIYGNLPANINCNGGTSCPTAQNPKTDASTIITFTNFQTDTNAAPASSYNISNYTLKSGSAAIGGGTANCAALGLTPCSPSSDLLIQTRGNPPSLGALDVTGGTTIVSSLVASPTTLSFGTVPIGTNSATQLTTVTNNGNVSITLSASAIGGTNSGDFLFGGTGSCNVGSVLAPGASCTLSIIFHPLAAGTRSGQLSETSNAANSPALISLTGTGGAPVVSLTPSTFNFGSIQAGTASAPRTFILQNTGVAPLTFTISTSASVFAQNNTCTSPLAASTSCNISVTFQPVAAGVQNGFLTVTSNAASSPNTSSLTGTGTAPPGLTLSPATVNFPNTLVNSSSAAVTITVTNPGATPITISSVSRTGANPADFTAGTCAPSMVVPAGGTCTIAVTFSPTTTGSKTAAVSLTDNSTGSPHQAALSGLATSPSASIVGSPLAFGNQSVGTTSPAQSLTLANTGNGPMTFSIALTGTNPGDFILSTSSCVSPLAGGQSCLIPLQFKPTTSGARSATVSVTDSASGSPHTGSVTGTGIVTSPAICLSTPSLNFGNQLLNTNSSTRSVNATNCGTSNLVFSGITTSVPNLDEFADAVAPCPNTATWCGVHDTGTPGTAVGTTAIVTSPALDGHSRQYITTFTGAGGLRWHLPFTLDSTVKGDPNSTQYTYDVQVYVVDTTHVNQLEFDMNQVLSNGNTVIYGTQCNFVFNVWDYTTNVGGSAQWTHSTIPCTKAAWTSAAWHHVVVKYHRDSIGVVTYDSVAFDGVTTAFTNASGNSAFSLGWTPIGLNLINFQINGDNTSNSATAYLDQLSISTGGFSQTNNCTTVVPGAFCTITSTFSPTVVGSIAGQFRISTNAASSPDSISLAGFGTLTGGVLTPTSVAFGSATIGVPTAGTTLTFLNTGNTSVTLGAPTFSGTNPGDFAATTTCGTVAPAASCTMSVVFTAGGAGARSATLNQAVGSSTLTVSLTGTGVALAPAVLLSPTTFDFGNVQQSTPSTLTTITLVNSGTANLTISSVTSTGANAADFAITNHCGGTVLPTANCLIDVVFTPSTTGAETAAVTIADNATGSPHSVALAGAGTAAPAPRVQPSTTSLTFPLTQVGISSAAQVVTVVNLGNSNLIFTSITKGSSNPGDFVLASGGTCTTVTPGQSCSIPVNFLPTAAGSRGATILLADNAAGSPQTITLSGTAFLGAPNLLIPISSVDFGNLLVGAASAPVVFTVTNSGTAAATVSFTVTGDFVESDTCNGGIAISASCAVTLTFAPTVLCGQVDSSNTCISNTHLGQLAIVSNTVNSPQNISLKGTALPATPPPGPVIIGMGGKTGVGGNMRAGVQ